MKAGKISKYTPTITTMKFSTLALASVGSLAPIIRPVVSDSSGIASFLRKPQTSQRSLVDNGAFTLVSVKEDETVTVSVKQVEFGSSSTCGKLATDATRAWHFFSVYMDPELAEPVCDYHGDVDACFEATYTVACDPDTKQASIELFIRDETYSPSQDKVTNPKVGSCLTSHDVLGKTKSWEATFDCTPPIGAPAPKAGPGDDCTTTEDCDVDLMCVPQQVDSSYYGYGGGGGPMPMSGPGPVRKLMTQLTRTLIGAPPPGPDSSDAFGGPSGGPPGPMLVDYNNMKCQPYLEEGNGCGIWEGDADCNPNKGLYCSTYSPHWCNGPTDMMGGTCRRDAGTCTTNADCNTDTHFCHAESSRCVPRGDNFACCKTNKQCLPGLTCTPQEDYYSPFGPGPGGEPVSWCE